MFNHPPDYVLAFARATLRPEPVLVIDAENRPVGRVPLEAAVASGQAFMGDLREGRIVFDADTETDPDAWAPAGRRALEAVGCRVVRVASGSPGSQHLWFIAPPGWTQSLLVDIAVEAGVPATQIRKGGSDCRPPLSPHRLGLPVRLLEPTSADAALRLLESRPGSASFNEEKWSAILTTGSNPDVDYGGKPSWMVCDALAVALCNAGMERDDLEIRWDSSPRYATKNVGRTPEQRAAAYDRIWAKAEKFVREHPPVSRLDEELAALVATAGSTRWVGKSGEVDRRIYERLVQVAQIAHATTVSQSTRALEEHLGISRKTVGLALKRLAGAGLLEPLDRPEDARRLTDSPYYLLRPQPVLSTPRCVNEPLVSRWLGRGVVPSVTPLHDAFRGRRGLGAAVNSTWLAVPIGSYATVAEIADARGGGLTRDTIRSHLKELRGVGMVRRNSERGRRWTRVVLDDLELNDVAAESGSLGHAANTVALNARSREVRDRELAEGRQRWLTEKENLDTATAADQHTEEPAA